MQDSTVQPPAGGWFPDRPAEDLPTDRYPEVQQVINEFFPAEPDDETRAVVAEHFRRNPTPEAETDAGFARLAGRLGIADVPAVA